MVLFWPTKPGNCNTPVHKDKAGEGLSISRKIRSKMCIWLREMWVHPESAEKKRMTCIIHLVSKDNSGNID